MPIFNTGKLISKYTYLNNTFITDYMPSSDANCLKVYIFGLYSSSCDKEITPEDICEKLDISYAEFYKAVEYWQELGLMEISSKAPLIIEYLPLSSSKNHIKFSADKYSNFNTMMQDLFPSRQILPTEYNEYYTLIELSKVDPMAVYLIANYCVKLKGTTVRARYIITVAKDWFEQGIRSVDQVEDKLLANEAVNMNVIELYKHMKKAGVPDIEDRELYLKWTNCFGYEHSSLLCAIDTLKIKSMSKLDGVIDDLIKLNIYSETGIINYKNHLSMLKNTTINVLTKLGLYYSSTDYIIEIYTQKWFNNGYSDKAINIVAHYCFMNNIKTLEQLDAEINDLYKNGIISDISVAEHFAEIADTVEKIKSILKLLNINRLPTNNEKTQYKLWTESFGYSYESILHIAGLMQDKTQPMSCINNALAIARERNIYTIDGLTNIAKEVTTNLVSSNTKSTKSKVEPIIASNVDEKIRKMLDNYDDNDGGIY